MIRLSYRFGLVIIFILCLIGLVAYARGYRLDLEKKSVQPTGIIAVSAAPRAANVYVDGLLKGVTDLNLTLSPGHYKIEVKKDGYSSWSKTVTLRGEVVLTLDVLLFPNNPSLSPLTNLGVTKATAIPNSEKIILFSATGNDEKDGILLFEPSRSPLSFLPPLKKIILKKDLPESVSFKNTTVEISPDLKQAIFTFPVGKNDYFSYFLSLDEELSHPFELTKSKDTLLSAWQEKKQKDTAKILETFPKEFNKVASDSFHIIAFSPDETKVLYEPLEKITLAFVPDRALIGSNQTRENRSLELNRLYVYDKKEDKNFWLTTDQNWMKKFRRGINTIYWHSDSKHLVMNEDKKITVVDYDGENKQTLYSGPLQDSFFLPVADGKLVILANLNPENNPLPDLYVVGTGIK
ncbi:PEGA domain-containing protein [Candidatus Roizmanbacteria bacterium]|nr:PEGA domain-containing protein [Candidatus Roizmanbacteria bacterium]